MPPQPLREFGSVRATTASRRSRPEFDRRDDGIQRYSGAEVIRLTSAPTVETRTVSIEGQTASAVEALSWAVSAAGSGPPE
ncbi:hypothetical protein [Nocardia sp. NPDC052112]|uniref:hypothetical protein n=1 Tax=Nocardia sp. NPDC052112 TaxID=3155646 RepID=UPI00342B423C